MEAEQFDDFLTNFGFLDTDVYKTTKPEAAASGLEAFLEKNYRNRLFLLTPTNYASVKRPLLVMYHQLNEKFQELSAWTDLLYKISAEFDAEIVEFAVADFKDLGMFHASWDDLDYFGFDANVPPYFFAVDSLERQFQFTDNIEHGSLVEYTNKLIDGELWRTQVIPEDADNNSISSPNIKTVVASYLEKSILEIDKDVVVTFHSNFTMETLHNLMDVPKALIDDLDNLVFFNYNAQENYLPLKYKIRNFPTSILIPQSRKDYFLSFEHHANRYGCYSHGDFKTFLAKNATTELKMYERNGRQKDLKAMKQKGLVNFLKENYGNKIHLVCERNYYCIERPLLVFCHQFCENFLQCKEWIDLLSKLEQNFSQSVQFGVADFDDLETFYMALDDLYLLEIDSSSPPLVFAVDSSKHEFQYDGAVTFEALETYCDRLSNNKLWKTEPIHDEFDNDNIIIKTLVAENFWQTIFTHKNDVLITFYKNSAFWVQTLDKTIEELKCDMDKLVFYKYNVELNHLPPQLKIHKFPTSVLIPAENKFHYLHFHHLDYLVYDNYEHPYYEDLVAFLAKNTFSELTNWNRKGQRRLAQICKTESTNEK